MPKKLTTKRIEALTGHQGSVYNLLFDEQLISVGGDGMAVSWNLGNLPDGELIAKVPTNVFSSLIIPDKKELLLGQLQGGIHVLDMNERKEVRHLAYHEKGVFDLKLLGGQVLAAGGDGKLSIWDSKNYELIRFLQVSEASIRSIAISPDEQTVALGCSDHQIYLLDAQNWQVLDVLKIHKNSVFALCYSPDGEYLLSGARDAQLGVWKAGEKYELCQAIPAHMYTINSVVYHPGGLYFATASRDKTIKIWDAQHFELLKVIDKDRLDGHVNSVNSLVWCDFNDWLISASDDRSLMIWDIKENE